MLLAQSNVLALKLKVLLTDISDFLLHLLLILKGELVLIILFSLLVKVGIPIPILVVIRLDYVVVLT